MMAASDRDNSRRHQRHKPATALACERPMVVAVPQLQSQVNVARVVRAAGCLGIRRLVLAGRGKIDPKIARDALDFCQIERHRSLPPVLDQLRRDGFRIVGLEQATGSTSVFDYPFHRQSVLVIGHERDGMSDELLQALDDVMEIPVYGRPLSYNAATSAILGMYEYCRQFPQG